MEFQVTIEQENYIVGKNLNNIKVYSDDSLIAQATMTLDELEDLECNLTDVLIQIAHYRRSKQREEL